jgi:L-fuculose-phosphate aldolase
MLYAEQREDVATAGHRLARERLVLGTAGNISVLVDQHVLVTPTGAVLGELEAGEVTVVDRGGQLVDGRLGPTSELGLHLALYDRGDAGAVIHTHSPAATALACIADLREVPMIHYAMLELGGAVPIVPHATFGTSDLTELVLAALRDRRAVLMGNHGAVCVADDLAAAVERCLLLEWVCEVYWRAAAIGRPALLDDQALDDLRVAAARYAARAMRPPE